jgi:hypothetical protein
VGIAKDPPTAAAPSSSATIASDQLQDAANQIAGTLSVSAPGFGAGSDLIAGTAPASSLAASNLLQTHTA